MPARKSTGAARVELDQGRARTKGPKSKSKAKAPPAPRRKPPNAEAGSILKLFQEADLDGNGEISQEELAAVFGNSLSPEEVHALVLASDADRDGVLDYSEFIHWVFNDCGEGQKMLHRASTGTLDQKALRRRMVDSDSCSGDEMKSLVKLKTQMLKRKKAALAQYPEFKDQVTAYFKETKKNLASEEFNQKVISSFEAYDIDHKGGVVCYDEVAELIRVSFQAVADLQKVVAPDDAEMRAFFDQHDTDCHGKGEMGPEEFVNFMQALHFKVHADLLPSRVAEWQKESAWRQLTSTLAAPEEGDDTPVGPPAVE